MTIIDKGVDKLLSLDALHMVEQKVGKHHQDFNAEEQALSFGFFILSNKIKTMHLQELGDTYFSMGWQEFLSVIENYGFKKGLSYTFEHEYYDDETIQDEAVLYYHPTKGLILWANSYGGDRVNEGQVYGQVSYPHPVEYKEEFNPYSKKMERRFVITPEMSNAFKVFNRCSRDAFNDIADGIHFTYDVREGLINKLVEIEEKWNFIPQWTQPCFLWFLDYTETKIPNYDHEEITKRKILSSVPEVQNILRVVLEDKK